MKYERPAKLFRFSHIPRGLKAAKNSVRHLGSIYPKWLEANLTRWAFTVSSKAFIKIGPHRERAAV